MGGSNKNLVVSNENLGVSNSTPLMMISSQTPFSFVFSNIVLSLNKNYRFFKSLFEKIVMSLKKIVCALKKKLYFFKIF